MPDSFRMGDAVRAVIGGPIMKVTNPDGAHHEIWCTWSDSKGVHREAFVAASLLRVDMSIDSNAEPAANRST